MRSFLIFIMISVCAYSSQIEILEKRNKHIEEKIQELEIKKNKSWSKTEYLKLKKELLNNKLELIKEKNSELKEKRQIQMEIDKLEDTKELLLGKGKEYKAKKDIMLKNPDIISEMEIKKIRNTIFKLETKLKQNKNSKEYYEDKLKDKKVDWQEIENLKSRISEIYKMLLDIEKQELKIMDISDRGEKLVKNKSLNVDILKSEKTERLKELERDKKSKKKDLNNAILQLDIIKDDIKILELEKEMIAKKIKAGLESKAKLFDKDMEYLEKNIEKLDYENRIKYLKMELAE